MADKPKIILSWVTPSKGYQETPPMSFEQAESVAGELKRKFPLVYETLTIREQRD